ncbi:MAG TPA: phytanoyl-CoA dioxygenase family protein [Pseudomonadales bacterium]
MNGVSGEDPVAQLREEGWCVVPDVLTPAETAEARERLWRAAERSRERGMPTYMPVLDPNDRNVRVFHLLELDPLFRELIAHPRALELVRALLGDGFLISNFTANIALPGSRSMTLHSDQALVVPPPWLEPWSINVIWCLHDVREANGATRYVPGSHRWSGLDQVPEDAAARSRAFEASAGSIIAMDGRVWHTSGANVTEDEQRALLFGYYSADFLRTQVNWNVVLSPATQAGLDDFLRHRLGLNAEANVRVGGEILQRRPGLQGGTQ